MREDYLSDTFDGIDNASATEIDANVLWKERQLLRFLIEAQEEACMRGDLIYDGNMFVDLVLDQGIYTLNPTALKIDKVIYNNEEVTHIAKLDLEALYPDWRDLTGMTDKPVYYYMTGYKMNIFPRPDAADLLSNPQVIIEGYRLPLNNILPNDELEIPLHMHKNVIWYALHSAYAMADADGLNYKESQVYLTKFDMAFGPKLDNRVIVHQLEQPRNNGYLGPIAYINSGTNKDNDWYN